MKKFEVKREGLTIRGKIFGDVSKKSPVCILSHGFMANQKTCRTYAKTLAKEGKIAVTYDFCGGGIGVKSDGKTEEMTVFTEKKDLLAVIDFFKKQEFAESISLLGCSQGGFVSAMVAKELRDQVKSLVLFYPALCIPDDARKGQMIVFKFDPKNIPDILGNFPMKVGGGFARTVVDLDVYSAIEGYDGPTFLIHGTSDRIVDIEYSRKAKELYPKCEYHEIENGAHGFKGKHDKEACRLLKEFAARVM